MLGDLWYKNAVFYSLDVETFFDSDGDGVGDFYGVDPRLGTLGDFVEFVHQADSRGIRVVIDVVVNHTSDRHPWFRDALNGKDARFHDWYVWSKKRPPDWESGT